MNLPAAFEMSQQFSLDGNLPDLTTFFFGDQISLYPVDAIKSEMGCFGVTEAPGAHQFGQDSGYQIVAKRKKVFVFPLRQYFPVSPPVFFSDERSAGTI